MTLKLNGSSSGYTAINAPASAGSNTLVLPADNGSSGEFLQTNGSGTLDWAIAGKILQVVHGSHTSEVSTTGTSFLDTGLSQAITPLQTGSQFLVFVHQHLSLVRSDNGQGGCLKLIQDSTTRFTPAENWQTYIVAGSVNPIGWRGYVSFTSKHAHGISAGTSTTYKTQMQIHTNNNSGEIYAQKSSNESMITIMEVGA